MKKVLQIVAALGFGFYALTGAVSAVDSQSCQVQTTGPSSVNVCTNVSQRQCTINNNNSVVIDNVSYQGSSTGVATVNGNTNGGDVNSGSSSNGNSTTINFTVNNGTEPVQGICAVTTVTRTPIETPVGGSGAAAPVQVAQLPRTSGVATTTIIAASAAALVALALGSKFAVAAYAKFRG